MTFSPPVFALLEKENILFLLLENITLAVVTVREHSMSLVIVIKLMEVGGSHHVSVPTHLVE